MSSEKPSNLTKIQQKSLEIADSCGHGKLFVISYPDKLLTTPYAISQLSTDELMPVLNDQTDQLDLYMHIPFCVSKCSYCHFAVSINQNEQIQTKYVDKLIGTVESFLEQYHGEIRSIDIGGGTPLLLSEKNLHRISQLIAPLFSSDSNTLPNFFSFEQTETLAVEHPEKMQAICSSFPNHPVRTSIGIQSFAEDELTTVRRPSFPTDIHMANFKNYLPSDSHVACDLIFPLGNLASWKSTVLKAISLGFDTITAYDLIQQYGGGAASFKSESLRTNHDYGVYYDLWYELMMTHGYVTCYGSNNAIKKSTLNRYLVAKGIDPTRLKTQDYLDSACALAVSAYFNNRLGEHLPFVGFGLSASSCLPKAGGGYLWTFQHKNLHSWMKSDQYKDVYDFPEHIWMTKGIRFSLANKGAIDSRKFLQQFGVSLVEVFPGIVDYLVHDRQWMYWDEDRLRLKQGAYTFLSHIRALFTHEHVLQWIINMRDESYQDSVAKARREFDRSRININGS